MGNKSGRNSQWNDELQIHVKRVTADYREIEQIYGPNHIFVYKMERKKDKKIVAVKRIDFGSIAVTPMEMRKKMIEEVRIHEKMHNPFILNFVEAFIWADYLYIVTDFCAGGNL